MKKVLFLLTGILLAVNLYSEEIGTVIQGALEVKEKVKEDVKIAEKAKEESKFIPYTKWDMEEQM